MHSPLLLDSRLLNRVVRLRERARGPASAHDETMAAALSDVNAQSGVPTVFFLVQVEGLRVLDQHFDLKNERKMVEDMTGAVGLIDRP